MSETTRTAPSRLALWCAPFLTSALVASLAAQACGGATPAANVPPSSLPPNSAWLIEAVTPQGQPFPGTYTVRVALTDTDGRLSGSGVWSTGDRTTFSGWRRGEAVHLDRVDEAGFRGVFEGELSANGQTMKGTGYNDPSSPGGNSAHYTWTAARQ